MKIKKQFNPFTSVLSAILLWIATIPLQAQDLSPAQWKFESQRAEIAPRYQLDNQTTFHGKPTLFLSGGGKSYCDGHYFMKVSVEPATFFKFHVAFIAKQVEEPDRSIQSRIIWQTENGKEVERAEYPATLIGKKEEGWSIMEQTYKVPEGATQAKLELNYRWDPDGSVNFGGMTFVKTTPPPARMVRLATIHHHPRNTKSTQEGLDQFAVLVARAGEQKADIVCLPEAITMVGTGKTYLEVSESVPGPTTKFLGELASKNHLYIVAGIMERQGDVVYNTAVLIDRQGKLAGVYHKTSLPREEIEGGLTPGDELPVFDTDFGRIGMMICWDVMFPEQARTLARKGAEVILMPIAGGNVTLAKARAIENQIYLVSSTYDMISAVFDKEGEVIKEATEKDPVAVVDVDLGKQKLWWWVGDFKNRIPREMPTEKAVRVQAN